MLHQLKLVLYSDQIPTQTDCVDGRLLALLGKRQASMAYVPSAPDPSRVFYRNCKERYARLGIELLPYVDITDLESRAHLDTMLNADAIHLSGGNTFVFLNQLRKHGLLDPLRHYAANGGILVGVSAGAILMTPCIHTSLLCGDVQPPSPSAPPNTTGLKLVEFAFVPHFGRYATMSDLQKYSNQHSQTVYGCPDGAAMVVDGDTLECIGDVIRIAPHSESV